MKNEQLYRRTIDILSRAYLEGTLQHGDPCGCAVGNLICASKNYKIVISSTLMWADENNFVLEPPRWFDHLHWKEDGAEEAAHQELSKIGYTYPEILQIEAAFEFRDEEQYVEDDPDGYLGLLAVVDCLDRIHEVNDPEITEQSKKRFVKEVAI